MLSGLMTLSLSSPHCLGGFLHTLCALNICSVPDIERTCKHATEITIRFVHEGMIIPMMYESPLKFPSVGGMGLENGSIAVLVVAVPVGITTLLQSGPACTRQSSHSHY